MTFGAYPLGGVPLGGQQPQGGAPGTSLVGGCGIMGGTMLNHCALTAASPEGILVRLSGRAARPHRGTLNIEQELGGRRSCRLTWHNLPWTPAEGDVVDVRWHHDLLFAGTIHELNKTIEPSHALTKYDCEALGWEHVLERRVMSGTYENQSAGPILDDVLARHLVVDGILRGTFQSSPTLVLARGEKIRIAEFMRDVAEASGGFVLLDPGKLLSFYKDALPAAPFTLDDASIETIEDGTDREDYRNKVTIRVRGTGGATVEVTRDDPAQIALRQATEGGSGLYEGSEEITHPTSNDPVVLQRYGIGYALIKLQLAGQSRRSLRARTRRHHLKVGQSLPVNLPASGLAGTWVLQRLRISSTDGERLQYELEAVLSHATNRPLEGLLRIVKAGRATVQLPGTLFEAGLTTFSTVGTFQFTVPGTGTVELEVTIYGSGGGGSAGFNPNPLIPGSLGGPGNPGGPGGRVVSFRSFPAGTILTIAVGAKGIGGASNGAPGTDGGDSKVERTGEVFALAQGGRGAITGPGAPGSGTGDHVTTGGGKLGGTAGTGGGGQLGGPGGDGQDGLVEIRF